MRMRALPLIRLMSLVVRWVLVLRVFSVLCLIHPRLIRLMLGDRSRLRLRLSSGRVPVVRVVMLLSRRFVGLVVTFDVILLRRARLRSCVMLLLLSVFASIGVVIMLRVE